MKKMNNKKTKFLKKLPDTPYPRKKTDKEEVMDEIRRLEQKLEQAIRDSNNYRLFKFVFKI